MIAHRFRTMGLVAGVASAGIGLYLISLQVAAERGRLDTVEQRIVAARHDVLTLQTEFGARGSMRQLERWNGQVLAMSAPKAVQFLQNEVQLASLVRPVQPAMDGPRSMPRCSTATSPERVRGS